MDRHIIGISLKDKKINTSILSVIKFIDDREAIVELKSNYAGYVEQYQYDKWPIIKLIWLEYKSRGRPPMRWVVGIKICDGLSYM